MKWKEWFKLVKLSNAKRWRLLFLVNFIFPNSVHRSKRPLSTRSETFVNSSQFMNRKHLAENISLISDINIYKPAKNVISVNLAVWGSRKNVLWRIACFLTLKGNQNYRGDCKNRTPHKQSLARLKNELWKFPDFKICCQKNPLVEIFTQSEIKVAYLSKQRTCESTIAINLSIFDEKLKCVSPGESFRILLWAHRTQLVYLSRAQSFLLSYCFWQHWCDVRVTRLGIIVKLKSLY